MSILLLVLCIFIGTPLLISAGAVLLTDWDRKVQIADATYPDRLSYRNRCLRFAVSFAVLCYACSVYRRAYLAIPGMVLEGGAAQLAAWAAACFCAGMLMPVLACYLPVRWHRFVSKWPARLFFIAALLVLAWAIKNASGQIL